MPEEPITTEEPTRDQPSQEADRDLDGVVDSISGPQGGDESSHEGSGGQNALPVDSREEAKPDLDENSNPSLTSGQDSVPEAILGEIPVDETADFDESFHQLDPRWVRMSRLMNLIVLLVVGFIGGGIGLAMFVNTESAWRWGVLMWPVFLAAAGYWAWAYPKLSHSHWSYRLAGNVVMLQHGILWRTVLAIPISRLQHVDLHSGPIERRFGLASLELHTAGTEDASHPIPGLDQDRAAELRDQLVTAVNDVRQQGSDDIA